MLGSQALDVAIGLAMLFFILATAASAIAESISRAMKKRAKDLEATILEMLSSPAPEGHESSAHRKHRQKECEPFFKLFKDTSVWQAAEAASGRTLLLRRKVGASYISAKSFADAVNEAIDVGKGALDHVPSLKKRLDALEEEARGDLLRKKAGLESWFDDTMDRAEGAYRRWASSVLFMLGLLLAVLCNAPATDVARDLWAESATRDAVVQAASTVGDEPSDITSVADATDKLNSVHLPLGWDAAGMDNLRPDNPVDFAHEFSAGDWSTVLGWLLTAVLIMLGGPFWFDLLNRLVALRSTGKKPRPAANDETSAMATVATAATAAAGRPEVTLTLPT